MQSGDVCIMLGEKKKQTRKHVKRKQRKIHISCMLAKVGTASGTTDPQAQTLTRTIRWTDVVSDVRHFFFLSYEEVLGKDHMTGSTCIGKCFVTYIQGQILRGDGRKRDLLFFFCAFCSPFNHIIIFPFKFFFFNIQNKSKRDFLKGQRFLF